MAPPQHMSDSAPHQRLAVRLRALRTRKGWNMDRLAEVAGVSRTTVYHLEKGAIEKPRAPTLYKLAVALEVEVEELYSTIPLPAQREKRDNDARGAFDKATNMSIREACAEEPELFEDWSPEDLEELYSTFGMGGALNRDGVRAAAERINRKRTVVQQLQVVLETHLGEVAEGLIDKLFAMVQAQQTAPAGLETDLPQPPHPGADE